MSMSPPDNSYPPLPPEPEPLPPTYLRRLTEFDGLDAAAIFIGFTAGMAAGNMAGLMAGAGLFVVQTVLRKTPVLLGLADVLDKAARAARGDQHILDEVAREIFPMLEDAPRPRLQAGHPVMQPPPPAQFQTSQTQPPAPIWPGQVSAPVPRPVPAVQTGTGRRASVYRGLAALPPLLGYQIVIYGPTGSGKSSVIKALLLARQEADVIILDPHYQPGSWPGRVTLAGAGLNWAAIDLAIDHVYAEMQARYQILATTQNAHFKPLILAVDELSALTGQVPDAGKRLFDLAQQGRKVQVWTMLTPHSTEVEQMGAQGRGEARENFVYIEMPFVPAEDKYKPRVVTVYYGNPRRKDNAPVGQFVVPTPKTYTGTPNVNPAWLLNARPRVQGVSQTWSGTRSEGVSQGGAGRKHTLDTPGHTHFQPATLADFNVTCGRDGNLTETVILHLLDLGYGVRKIGDFLPFASQEARQLVASVRKTYTGTLGSRPSAGSPDEKTLVAYLRGLGVPLPRIATLLDGNDAENLTRISAY